MIKWILSIVLVCSLFSCKHKEEKKIQGAIVSALSYLKAQAKAVDTSSRPILKIEKAGTTSDSSIISKAEFHKYAEAFLTLPDISIEERKENYEEATDYDELMNKVFMTYSATDPDEEIRRQTVISEPSETGESHITTILINRAQSNKDSTVEQDMTWHANKRFQIVTKTTKAGEPEKIKILIVSWE